MAKDNKNNGRKLVCTNKRAHYDYFLSDFYECGLVLKGTEVKSLRKGHGSLTGSYVEIRKDGAYVIGMNISEYKEGNIFNSDPLRDKKLLLHKLQLRKLYKQKEQAGYTIVPVQCYFKNGLAKIEIALGKGKKEYDKRETIKERDLKIKLSKKYNDE